VSRQGTRFVWTLTAIALLAGVLVSAAAALRFSDESYLTPEGVVGTPYTHRFWAPPEGGNGAGCDPPYIVKVDSGGLPPGLSLASDGWVSGTPTEPGSWSFWVSIHDDPTDKPWCDPPHSAEREFTIRIIPKLTIGPESVGTGTVGVSYSVAMTATLSEPKTWSISTGALPPGLTLGATDGVISGTPTTAGSYAFTVLAVVDPKRSDTKALTIAVRDPLAIAGREPFGAQSHVARTEVGLAYRATLASTGGSGTYMWSLASGPLPPGLSLAVDGTIGGRPTTAGRYRFTVSAADTEGRTASYNGLFTVAPRLTIATQQLRPAKVGRPYSAKLRADGGVNPKKYKIKRGRLPRGVRFDPAVGEFSGSPTKAGTYRIAVEVVDALGVRSTKTLVIDVLA
jgi:large repetitive protein